MIEQKIPSVPRPKAFILGSKHRNVPNFNKISQKWSHVDWIEKKQDGQKDRHA